MLGDERGAGDSGSPSVNQAVQAIEFVEFAQGFRVACLFGFSAPVVFVMQRSLMQVQLRGKWCDVVTGQPSVLPLAQKS